MAENQLLEAINGIKTSVAAMENQMKAAPTKADLSSTLTEIRGVKENVIRNTDRIDTLFDLRKNDGELLAKKVEQIVDNRISTTNNQRGRSKQPPETERSFLRCRRSVRLWPIRGGAGLEQAVKDFLRKCLCMPQDIIEGLTFEKVEKQSQSRRSKIQDEVLVMLETSQQRDVIQSYAANLAAVQSKAGMRLDIPDHLRGLFRLFETHAAALKAEFGAVKRAIRFDDINSSLYMDVKLEDTEWHRITDEEMRKIQEKKQGSPRW